VSDSIRPVRGIPGSSDALLLYVDALLPVPK